MKPFARVVLVLAAEGWAQAYLGSYALQAAQGESWFLIFSYVSFMGDPTVKPFPPVIHQPCVAD